MFVLALILSKLVLVVILLVAVTQVSAPIDADLSNIADPLAGVVLMALAGFAPYMTYRFLSFVGFDLYNSMGTEQEARAHSTAPCRRQASRRAANRKRSSTRKQERRQEGQQRRRRCRWWPRRTHASVVLSGRFGRGRGGSRQQVPEVFCWCRRWRCSGGRAGRCRSRGGAAVVAGATAGPKAAGARWSSRSSGIRCRAVGVGPGHSERAAAVAAAAEDPEQFPATTEADQGVTCDVEH